ncbi:MAG TPA: hypothetical protein VMU02_00195 [bacterium]|nr:hypothetical protein [bacterium]
MKYVVWFTLLGLALSLGCGGGGGAVSTSTQKVTLAYKQLGGASSQYKMTSSVTLNSMGNTNSWVSDVAFTARVESISTDGVITRRITFDDFSIFEQSGGKLEPDNLAPGYKGQYLWMQQAADGKVLHWNGLDGIRSYTAEDRDLKNVLVQQMATAYQPLPTEAVGVGSKWQGTLEIPVTIRGGEFTQKITVDYEVVGFGQRGSRNCVKIQTRTATEGKGTGNRAEDRQFWVNTTGSGKGFIWFDYDNGLIVEYETNVTADQELKYERTAKTDIATEASTVDSQTKIKLVK